MHIPDKKCRNLNLKLLECMHLGYAENSCVFLCLHHPTGRVLESRDVVFNKGDSNGPTQVAINIST